MAKIEFSKVTNGNTLSVINENFDKLANELQEKVYYRNNPDGEPNSLGTPMDFNGNVAYNIGNVSKLPESDIPGQGPIVFATEYGTPLTQSTFNAAVQGVKDDGGGMLYVPNEKSAGLTIPDLGNTVTLEMNGPDVAVSHFGEARGTAGVAQKLFYGQNDRINDKIHSVVHVESHPKGSGQSGQVTADCGLSVSVIKQGVGGPNTRSGEVNGIDISTRNGGADCDSAALLLNVGAYGTGFHCLLEGIVTDVQNNVVVRGLNTQLCVINNRDNQSFGLIIQSQTGGQDVGILIQNTTGLPFNDFLIFKYDGIEAYRVNGLGFTTIKDPIAGRDHSSVSFGVANGILTFQNSSNTASLMSLNQNGRLSVNNEIAYGAIILKNQIVGTATAGTIDKPTQYSGYLGMEFQGQQYRIPYYNA